MCIIMGEYTPVHDVGIVSVLFRFKFGEKWMNGNCFVTDNKDLLDLDQV